MTEVIIVIGNKIRSFCLGAEVSGTLDNVIDARNIVKEYNGKRVVKEISFCVKPRECFGLLGPNGAGKSSTVKMIYCFTSITAGTLLVLGMDVRTRPRDIKRRIGVVAQDNNLDPDLTVLENLLVYAGFFDIPARTALGKAEELLDFFDLTGYKKEKVDKLSGGMKRRLAIARALINSPEILVLDEPTTGLDPQARHLVWQRLRKLKENGVTLLLTTHYMEEASQLCDRIVFIDDGKILEEGPPHQLIKKHIGEQILEIGRGAELMEKIVFTAGDKIKGYMVIGDTLFIYPSDGQSLMEALRPLALQFSYQTMRYATLEDVFLKLTGKELAG
ncbi:MAG: ATP-binding cassette domain-containing protein [Pelotomaculum sp.]|nr:ATP-binding cassette domain-containing protein [Pelotomaculum sp.]